MRSIINNMKLSNRAKGAAPHDNKYYISYRSIEKGTKFEYKEATYYNSNN